MARLHDVKLVGILCKYQASKAGVSATFLLASIVDGG